MKELLQELHDVVQAKKIAGCKQIGEGIKSLSKALGFKFLVQSGLDNEFDKVVLGKYPMVMFTCNNIRCSSSNFDQVATYIKTVDKASQQGQP
jgi:hypothetical protein